VIVAGASIGAFNALALVCRFPDLFRAAVCMSGTYDIERFIGGFTDDLFFSSPMHFLPGLEGPALDALRQRFVVLASGSGKWEDTGESWRAAGVLGDKGVPNRVDDWGPAYDHDWPTWWQMLPEYLEQLT
jgi:esterase/lipase superfamily enzyme